uniref:Uncharacterized protein n=1 Tax=Chromera velia CCMP2878 TaxID=1169474 RepID=A0A0G4G7J8_9ALVE|eukprot:Cvel_20626.t1-p1 / transcript=Cvel_20626.t1 / gene=Cvel_20626 / organism=Chromera_velia_CCMP2878 / gene_product=hypothetical protein / transcript_product=hypothetical protein / location=Cvel_scaffold1869:8971-13799(-) / protein_length=721 / sequence_SO=supercontig / SO=protein_coding / is_pseudo=false
MHKGKAEDTQRGREAEDEQGVTDGSRSSDGNGKKRQRSLAPSLAPSVSPLPFPFPPFNPSASSSAEVPPGLAAAAASHASAPPGGRVLRPCQREVPEASAQAILGMRVRAAEAAVGASASGRGGGGNRVGASSKSAAAAAAPSPPAPVPLSFQDRLKALITKAKENIKQDQTENEEEAGEAGGEHEQADEGTSSAPTPPNDPVPFAQFAFPHDGLPPWNSDYMWGQMNECLRQNVRGFNEKARELRLDHWLLKALPQWKVPHTLLAHLQRNQRERAERGLVDGGEWDQATEQAMESLAAIVRLAEEIEREGDQAEKKKREQEAEEEERPLPERRQEQDRERVKAQRMAATLKGSKKKGIASLSVSAGASADSKRKGIKLDGHQSSKSSGGKGKAKGGKKKKKKSEERPQQSQNHIGSQCSKGRGKRKRKGFFAPTHLVYMWVHRTVIILLMAGLAMSRINKVGKMYSLWLLPVILVCLKIVALDLYTFPRRPVLRILFTWTFKSFSLIGFAANTFVGVQRLESPEETTQIWGVVVLLVNGLLIGPLLVCILENDELKRDLRVVLFYPALVGKPVILVVELLFSPFWMESGFSAFVDFVAIFFTVVSLLVGLLEALRVINIDDWGHWARMRLARAGGCFGDCVTDVRRRSRRLSTKLRMFTNQTNQSNSSQQARSSSQMAALKALQQSAAMNGGFDSPPPSPAKQPEDEPEFTHAAELPLED